MWIHFTFEVQENMATGQGRTPAFCLKRAGIGSNKTKPVWIVDVSRKQFTLQINWSDHHREKHKRLEATFVGYLL